MNIKSNLTSRSGQKFNVEYFESDPNFGLGGKDLSVVHAFCFCAGKMVIVFAKAKDRWEPPGGGVEKGESWQEATIREIKEESNMKVLHYELIGFQDVYETYRISRQTRTFCIVEPCGDFVSDPDGDITEIKLIDPKDYRKYFDWGIIGDRIMERAIEMNKKYLSFKK